MISSSCTTSATTSSSVSNNNVKFKQSQQHHQPQQQRHEDLTKNNKSAFKRFGISPRFKRKIVEAITKTNTNHNNAANNAQIIQKPNVSLKFILFNTIRSSIVHVPTNSRS